MTETRLRTFANAAAYSLLALFMAALAFQNLRFGFYELFYLAAALTLAGITGVSYTLTVRTYQLRARWHPAIAAACHLLALSPVLTGEIAATVYWHMPVIVLTALILPLRQALLVITPFVALHGLLLLALAPGTDTLIHYAALLLLAAGALLSSWHYDHMAQSAEDLAITDPVTGAHNTRFLNETLQKEISRARYSGHPLSVIILGIDHHEQIAELLDHDQLHQLYRNTSNYLFSVIRAGDTLYFLGDGQFCLILPFTPEEGARVSAERIRRSIAQHPWPDIGRMTVSLGITTYSAGDTLADTLRQRAATALTEAWRLGPDSCWFNRASPDPS